MCEFTPVRQYTRMYPGIYTKQSNNVNLARMRFPVKGNGQSTRTVVIVVVSSVGGLLIFVCLAYYLLKSLIKTRRNAVLRQKYFGNETNNLEPLQFSLATIEAATNKFSHENCLGQGGFGRVYKGVLSNSQEIAIKRLSKRRSRFPKRQSIELGRALKIIRGVARGIPYLHEYSRLKVIHRDLKPINILLDNEMNPKISDFGLAKLVAINTNEGNTNIIVGTYQTPLPQEPAFSLHAGMVPSNNESGSAIEVSMSEFFPR
ncbi:hypothetical protein K1719_005220 [Acacia pycnantha]|nr:hypothetical protein K1719_005220 [Acacia pycnantha]